jgi:hypothetical protein
LVKIWIQNVGDIDFKVISATENSNTIPKNQVLEGKISRGRDNTLAIGHLGVPHKSNFFLFAMSQFDWPHKKIEAMEAPQNRRFYGKMGCLHIWPTYWEHREHIENRWEPLGTCWEQMKNQTNLLFPPSPSSPTTLLKT